MRRKRLRLGEGRCPSHLSRPRAVPGRKLHSAVFKVAGTQPYLTVVDRLGNDLPELLSFFSFPRHLWKKLRTTNVIERCFVEVRRRTRPRACFVNVQSVGRIIYSIIAISTGRLAPSSQTQAA